MSNGPACSRKQAALNRHQPPGRRPFGSSDLSPTVFQTLRCAQSLQQLADAKLRLDNEPSAAAHLGEASALLEQTELPGNIARFQDRFADRLKSRRSELRSGSNFE